MLLENSSRPGRRPIFLALGNKPGAPWADIRVRKAMYMAVNEEEIIAKVMRGQASPAAQVADSAMVGYAKDIQRLPYDPEQAKKLLEEAGSKRGFAIGVTEDAPVEALENSLGIISRVLQEYK